MRVKSAGLAALLGLAVAIGAAGMAAAASEMSEAEYRAALEACKQLATAQLKDECVSNAQNRYGRGKGIEKKAGEAGKAGKAKAMGKAEKEASGAKAKGAEMTKGKGKKN